MKKSKAAGKTPQPDKPKGQVPLDGPARPRNRDAVNPAPPAGPSLAPSPTAPGPVSEAPKPAADDPVDRLAATSIHGPQGAGLKH
jgi:hypothetical protein